MLIFRIENDRKDGIYNLISGGQYEKFGGDNKNDELYHLHHPSPFNDLLISKWWTKLYRYCEHLDYRFAFKDVDQLLDWFPIESLKQLQERQEKRAKRFGEEYCSFGVSIYSVNKQHCKIGERQAVFKFKEARLVKKYSFVDFIEMHSEEVQIAA